ncbi:Ovule protein [Pseudomonas sp. IT-P258]
MTLLLKNGIKRSQPAPAPTQGVITQFSGIVTKYVKSVYQIHGYMNEARTPKISHANKAT